MKKALIIFAWISILGSTGDILIGFYGAFLSVFNPTVEVSITVDSLIKNHVGFLYWTKRLGYYVLPAGIVNWLFGLPALTYFPVKVVFSVFIGWYALRFASNLE